MRWARRVGGTHFREPCEAARTAARAAWGTSGKICGVGMQTLRMHKRMVYDVKANWKLIVQNYNECLALSCAASGAASHLRLSEWRPTIGHKLGTSAARWSFAAARRP